MTVGRVSPRPVAPAPRADRVPQPLRLLVQWVVWKFSWRQEQEKWTKPPYRAIHGTPAAKSTDPATWCDFDQAMRCYQAGACDGIGFVFKEGGGLVGVDLDDCRDPQTGELEHWASTIIEQLGTYTEASPSGTGVHMILRGQLPPGGRRKGLIEMYESGRYFTMTGATLGNLTAEVESRQAELTALHAEVFGNGEQETSNSASPASAGQPRITSALADDELLERAKNAANGTKFDRLWRGDWAAGYQSQSEADLALSGMLAFWTGRDAQRIDSLFRRSGLMRPKWDQRHSSSGKTYGEVTTSKAIESCQRTHGDIPLGRCDNGEGGRARALASHSPSATVQSTEPVKQLKPDIQWPHPLRDEAYHGLAGDIVRLVEPNTESDPAALLVQLLVGVGNVVGRTAYYEVEADRHYTNLFACLVGRTAKGRKGTSWGNIRRWLEEADPDWVLDRVYSGLSTGEGLIHAVRDEQIEEDEVVDPGEADKRLLVYESEFASVLRKLEREGNSLSALMRQAWDSSRLQTMTKRHADKATNAHISIIGHITCEELQRYLNRTEAANGFANRFLWVCVKRSKCLPFGGSGLDLRTLLPMQEQLSLAIQRTKAVSRITLDPEARRIWAAVYPELSTGEFGMFGAVTSRSEPISLRLACIYALLDQSVAIRKEHLLAALEIWRYCSDSARHIFGDSLGDPVADQIMLALRGSPEGMTRTELSAFFKRNKPSHQIARALALLLAHGKVRRDVLPSNGGRAPERWRAI